MTATFTAVDGSTVTPRTRADLMKHPGFAGLNVDSEGNPCVWRNSYSCQSCTSEQIDWQDDWSCECDDDCPACGKSQSPTHSDWLPDAAPGAHWYFTWRSLPEAGSQQAAATPIAADQPRPMWICAWVTNYGENDLRDIFTIHDSEAEAQLAYERIVATHANLHSALIAPISKATEPHWQDQR